MRLGINGAIFLLWGFLLGCTQEREMTGPWQLDNEQSRLSFVSTKAVDVSEVHRFSELSGSVSVAGEARVAVELASVDTLIPIRDERMREMLFNTKAFPTASLSAKVDAAKVLELDAGETLVTTLQGQLSLHGQSNPVTAELVVARLASGTLLVSSRKPLIVQAGDFDLLEGVEKLREVAGLSSISSAIPVSFVLTFEQN